MLELKKANHDKHNSNINICMKQRDKIVIYVELFIDQFGFCYESFLLLVHRQRDRRCVCAKEQLSCCAERSNSRPSLDTDCESRGDQSKTEHPSACLDHCMKTIDYINIFTSQTHHTICIYILSFSTCWSATAFR